MDALLLALIGCLVGEIGDTRQRLAAALATRFESDGAVLAGAVLAVVGNAAIAALAGAWIGPMLGADARLLFLALAILFLGAGMIWRVSPPDDLAGWRIGAFPTSALGLFILGFGDGSQFLILGIAARTGDPLFAGVGGAIGVVAALVPAVALRHALLGAPWIIRFRRAVGVVVLLIGAAVALSAMGLL